MSFEKQQEIRMNIYTAKKAQYAYLDGSSWGYDFAKNESFWQSIETAPVSKEVFEHLVDLRIKAQHHQGETSVFRLTDCYVKNGVWYHEHLSLGSWYPSVKNLSVTGWMYPPKL